MEGFKKTILKQHFKTLGKYLHLVDPRDEDTNDALCKVPQLVTLLEDKFADDNIPGKNISVDEGLLKFNGRLSFKEYMPMFQLKGLGYYVVWTLGEPYLDDHRHFFFDNFFTTTDLMRDLESRDTYTFGTVRINRRNLTW